MRMSAERKICRDIIAQRERHSGLLVLDASQGEHHPPERANVSIQILIFQFFSLLQEWGYSCSTKKCLLGSVILLVFFSSKLLSIALPAFQKIVPEISRGLSMVITSIELCWYIVFSRGGYAIKWKVVIITHWNKRSSCGVHGDGYSLTSRGMLIASTMFILQSNLANTSRMK